MSTLEEWLKSFGLGKYFQDIQDSGISTLDELKEFESEEELKEIVTEIGSFKAAHRIKFMREAKKLAGISNTQPQPQPQPQPQQPMNNEGMPDLDDSPTNNNRSSFNPNIFQRWLGGNNNNNNNNRNRQNRRNNNTNNQNRNGNRQNRINNITQFYESSGSEDDGDEKAEFGLAFTDGPHTHTIEGFTLKTTVGELKAKYGQFSGKSNIVSTLNFSCDGNRLTDDFKKLHQLGLDRHSLITVINPNDGGSQMSGRKLRKSKFGAKINRVMAKDLLMDDIVEPCAKMPPCNHTISSDTMYDYMTTYLSKNPKKFKIKCPLPKCRKVWDWKTCCAVADLTTEEYHKLSSVISRRRETSTGLCKMCPKCHSLCYKPKKVGKFRVSCTRCTGQDFCFVCGEKWTKSGFTLCGNPNCPMTQRQEELLTCPIIARDENKHNYTYYGLDKDGKGTIDYGKDKNGNPRGVPLLRACPRCFTILQHKKQCKHMKCTYCKKSFCWICLSLKDENGNYPDSCGKVLSSSYEKGYYLNCSSKCCPLADRQIIG